MRSDNMNAVRSDLHDSIWPNKTPVDSQAVPKYLRLEFRGSIGINSHNQVGIQQVITGKMRGDDL